MTALKNHELVSDLRFESIGYDRAELGLVFENCQAWTRKLLELAVACQRHGIDEMITCHVAATAIVEPDTDPL